MAPRVKRYPGDGIVVTFEPRRCIHAAECVARLPTVFDPGRVPWVDPRGVRADALAEVVARCPTGALQAERTDGGPAEAPDAENRVRVTRNGPLHLRGDLGLRAEGAEGGTRATRVALCRCGASRNRPFCDGSHRERGFGRAD